MAVRSIRLKVVSIIIAVLVLSVAVSIIITVRNQRENLLDETRKNLTITGDILNSVVRNLMLGGEAPIATETLADIQGIEEFIDITIYRPDGTNAFNDDSTIKLVNSYIGKEMFESTERAELRRIDNENFDEVLKTNTPVDVESPDERTLEYYFPILNYAECRSCHGDSGFIRGIAHYQVSTEQIYNTIDSARNLLAVFFVASGFIIAFVLIILLRRIIIGPLLEIGSAVGLVGTGNLEVRVDLKSKDELGTLAVEINSMIGGLREKNRLEIENSVIDARNQENRKYLENINEGLLLLDHNQIISDQYSTFLETLFSTDEIAGRKFSDFLYPGGTATDEELKEIDQFVNMIFSNVNTEMEMIMSINPLTDKSLTVSGPGSPREIVIDTNFLRIMGSDGVENVMVIFEDKTELVRIERALETEKIRGETEIEHIQAILRSGPQSFIEFAEEANSALRAIDENLDNLEDSGVLNALFRDIHSLKGAARYMELRGFAGSLHETEELIAAARDGSRQIDGNLRKDLTSALEVLNQGVDSIKGINDKFKEFSSQEGLQELFSKSIRGFFENMERMATAIAEELGKSVKVRTSTDFDSVPFLKELRDPVIHIVRNSLDHGIEESLERISKGKDDVGLLEIRFLQPDPARCLVEIRDDGAGIDFAKIRQKAIEAGIISETAEPGDLDLLKILFLPAFSSKSDSTAISGRGVGLDAVHAAVTALGGSISVATQKDRGTKFSLKIPIPEA
ncbi:MAG: HAMP domain-containing protein [Spirochaetales bacterium]|nr:HAMP domain-containing protein [Spirochaetales bacterium]